MRSEHGLQSAVSKSGLSVKGYKVKGQSIDISCLSSIANKYISLKVKNDLIPAQARYIENVFEANPSIKG